ncbi:MAG: phosphopantetheine-binding protein [Clostridia bacterium]|nr:phosphopantetheine-binding protein [Clostridia bacterium]
MVFDKVAAILAEYVDADASTITNETSFEELGIDSLDMLDMAMALEEELGGVELELSEDIKTVGDLVSYAESKMA